MRKISLLLFLFCFVYISCGENSEQKVCDKLAEIIKSNLTDPESFESRSCKIFHKKNYKDALNELFDRLDYAIKETSKNLKEANEDLIKTSDIDSKEKFIANKRMLDVYNEFLNQANVINSGSDYEEFLNKEMVHIYESVSAAKNAFGGKVQHKFYFIFKENEQGEFNEYLNQTEGGINVEVVGNLYERLPGIGELLEKYTNYLGDVFIFNAPWESDIIDAMKEEGVYDTYLKSIK